VSVLNYYLSSISRPAEAAVDKSNCKYNCLVILAHCQKIENDYCVGGFFFEPQEFLNRSEWVWISGCYTANIQATYPPTYDRNDFSPYAKRVIQSLILDTTGSPPSFVSVRWIVAFLEFMSKKRFYWWLRGDLQHPVLSLALLEEGGNPLRGFLRANSYQQWIHGEVKKLGSSGDEILFPYRTSFVEVFHYGVFVAHYLSNKDLKLLIRGEAKKAYFSLRKQIHQSMAVVMEPGRQLPFIVQGNFWFEKMRSASAVQGSYPLLDNTIAAFQSQLQGTISDQFPHAPYVSCAVLRERLLCYQSPKITRPKLTSLAIVFRVPGQGHSDFRLSAGTKDYRKVVRALVNACPPGRTIVLMDSQTTFVPQRQGLTIIDLRGHHKPDRREAIWEAYFKNQVSNCPPLLDSDCDILNQLWFLSACIQRFNITAAYGVHGGFLDILNAFGVAPTRTYREFTGQRTKINREYRMKVSGWKERTFRLCQRFYPDDESACRWQGEDNSFESWSRENV
jgi:hypothetical protein